MDPHMHRAILLAAKAGLGERSGGCFGAVVVRNGEVVGEGYNQVLTKHDPTWHAEMQAIRNACSYLHTHNLSDCELYTSSEPCQMCSSAIMWAKIPVVKYASTAYDAQKYGNFNDARMTSIEYKKCTKYICDTQAREKMLELWEAYQNSAPTHY